MIYFLKGVISQIDKDSVIVDVHDVGYQVLVSHIDDFQVNEEVKLYTYTVIREDEQYLIGFKNIEEKMVFMSLIKVKGLGPKTVIGALKDTTPNQVLAAISSNNVAYLKKLPGIGSKAASQIILDLKGLLTGGDKGNPDMYSDVFDALKEMGFKGTVIDKVLASINEPNATSDEILRIALRKLNEMKKKK